MPDLKPFRGVRYSSPHALADMVCPPYDVISDEDQARLHERHPHNAVYLESSRPRHRDERDRYQHAAGTFDEWIREGVLRQDESPAFYVYRQDFELSGRRHTITGVIGALKLEPFGSDSGVLPHERTMPGPIEDRLTLMRACPVNVSPIYTIYRGAGRLDSFYAALARQEADAHFSDEQGTLHRLWTVDDGAELRLLSSAVAPGPLVIADGHHRYETALAYHHETGGAGRHDSVMALCVDADTAELIVRSYHRVLRSSLPEEQIAARLDEHFDTLPAPAGEAEDAALESSAGDHPFTFVFSDSELVVTVSDGDVVRRVGAKARAWRSLDVVALHEALVPEVFGDEVPLWRFTTHAAEVRSLVRQDSWSAGVLLRPLDAVMVVEVARSGERMPQKASYFWPKAITGLVFRTLH